MDRRNHSLNNNSLNNNSNFFNHINLNSINRYDPFHFNGKPQNQYEETSTEVDELSDLNKVKIFS